ncbi:MAG: hypothetical protein DHS20C05_07660 [Hyphococcus sp.]|nr:MAG: hypothetical protein DHS20C05_07660 [Marinicaulis sp.]
MTTADAKDRFTFFHPLRVRWAECDAQGIVFNVNYFLYFDVAMTEYMRALGVSFSGDKQLEFYTVSANADYHGSAVFDDELEVGVRCERLGKKSLSIVYGIFRGNEHLTSGTLVYVHAEPGTKNTSPLPSWFIDRLTAFEKIAPERKPQ